MRDGSETPPGTRPSDPDEPARPPVSEGTAEVEKRDPSGGPKTLDWWLDDGPDSPIAADIKEPEKHL